MKKYILKQSQLLGLKTFSWEIKLHVYAFAGYPVRRLAYLIGYINNLQMKFDRFLRFKLFYILLLSFIFVGCSKNKKEYPYKLGIANSNLSKNTKPDIFNFATIECDSFNFISSKEVIAYRDGVEVKVVSNNFISVSNGF